MAEGRPPGVYLKADGAVATVVFEGLEPDPAVLTPLQARMASWGLTVICHPGENNQPGHGDCSPELVVHCS